MTRKLTELESWFLANDEIGEEFRGQFPPREVGHNISATYGEAFTLNRQNAILQFLHGDSEVINFTARLFAETMDVDLLKPYKMLTSWARKDPDLLRPPVLLFWIGNATVAMTCVIESLGGIVYHDFRPDGSPRDITFEIALRQYVEYALEAEESDTRYHRAKQHDYYEWLTQREYGDPMLGVPIRQDHPTKPLLSIGDIVTLPSRSRMRKRTAKTQSIPLRTAYGKKDTPQRNLRVEVFDRLNRSYVSHIL